MPRLTNLATGGLVGALALAAMGAATQHRAPSLAASVTGAAPAVITITARDYAFEAPDTIAAGLTTIRLVNRGPELHHVQLVKLEEGRTMTDFFAALKAGGPPPRWAREVGGPNTPVPGGESEATLDLMPGRYAVVCFIPSPDGTPHIMKGMTREMVVAAPRGASARPASVAAPAMTMTLTDYRFELSAPLTAGRHTLRVRNAASQPHEVVFARLEPGKTAAEMAAWAEKHVGPPPGAPLGGTTAMAPGLWNDVTLSLTPGEYALLCFIPDAKDGKPHIVHGMVHQITVPE